ncbi:hypothetical protein [Xanthomonas vasicola]|nr:hypothetical protein [Xanthomonas vasicola]
MRALQMRAANERIAKDYFSKRDCLPHAVKKSPSLTTLCQLI